MREWNAMTFEGKPTILRVVRAEAERMFALAERPEVWESPTACADWSTRDIVGHIIDTTEGYFRAFDAARGTGQVPEPHGLPLMAQLANEGATAFRGVPQAELIDRLRVDFEKMQGLLEALGPDDWTGLMVTHAYLGPVPAFFYAAGQLLDYGVHSWDIRDASGPAPALSRVAAWHIRETSGRGHARSGEAADLLVPFMFAIWQGRVRAEAVTEPFTIGVRVVGPNGGDYRVSVSGDGLTYETGEIESLPAYLEFDAASLVLRAFGR